MGKKKNITNLKDIGPFCFEKLHKLLEIKRKVRTCADISIYTRADPHQLPTFYGNRSDF